MLVLSRKIGEQIVLPECGVTIHVVAVGKKRVRLGIVAPSGAPVHRSEVWNRIVRANGHSPNGGEIADDAPAALPDGAELCAPATPSDELDAALARWIARRAGGLSCQ
jgi:carbon storage regulator CsrA